MARYGDLVLTGLDAAAGAADAEAAGAWGVSAVLDRPHAGLDLRGLPAATAASVMAGACLRAWARPGYHTVTTEDAPRLERLSVLADDPAFDRAWAALDAGVTGCIVARDLVTEPANMLTPPKLRGPPAGADRRRSRDLTILRTSG